MHSTTMKPIIMPSLFSFLFMTSVLSLKVSTSNPNAQITVMGLVYCDICSNNSFSRHSYFISGAEVRIDCQIKAASAKTIEQIKFSVNRTTNRLGLYKLEIPSVEGVVCAKEAMASSCQATLMQSSSSSCNIPGHRTTVNQISFKSKRSNQCIYGLNALNFRPSRKNLAICAKQ